MVWPRHHRPPFRCMNFSSSLHLGFATEEAGVLGVWADFLHDLPVGGTMLTSSCIDDGPDLPGAFSHIASN